jgi:hypothetical protein
MKTFLCFLLLLISFPISAQKTITKEDWQSDLKFLQETVHESFPFLFKKISAKDFDANVAQFHKEIPNLETHEIVVGFAKIVASFQYGHTSLAYWSSPVTLHQLPLKLYEFTDGVYITGIHQDYQDIVGGKVIAIEETPIQEVFKAIYPTIPVENEYYFKAYGISDALIPEVLHAQGITKELKNELTLTLEINGKTIQKTIKAVEKNRFPLQYGEVNPNSNWVSARDQSQSPLYLSQLDKNYFFIYRTDSKTLYVRYSQVLDDTSEKVHSFFKRVFDTVDTHEIDKFILDVRLNGGGNNFNNKQVVKGIIQRTKIDQKGKLFVITGRRTFSAAQNLINELDNYTEATFVGEPSSENINFFGDNKRMRLPKSGLNAYLSWAWWQDKPQWQNDDYMVPDVLVKLSFQEYVANQDPVLQKIMEQ